MAADHLTKKEILRFKSNRSIRFRRNRFIHFRSNRFSGMVQE
jgi:hypothetical protein